MALIGVAIAQPAMAATGYWRFSGNSVSPPQSQLDETDRATRAMGRASETKVSGAFQAAGSGAGSVKLFLKNDDVDRRGYLTTLEFSFTAGVDMQTLTPGQKIRVNGVLVMGGNGMSKALPANGSGTIAIDNGDYFVTTNGAIDQSASASGEFLVPGGAPGGRMVIHVEAHLGSYGGLTGRMDIVYEWVAGPTPRPQPQPSGPVGGGSGPSGGFAGTWDTSEGAMSLTQNGAQVSGTYSQDNGRIQGQVSGGRLVGYWTEDSAGEQCATQRFGSFFWGRIVWVLSADGRHFQGQWSYCEAEPGGSWTGDRTGGGGGGAVAGSPGGPVGPDRPGAGFTVPGGLTGDRGARSPAAERLLANVGNTAACGFTDTAVLALTGSAHVTRVDIWYHWASGETSVGYTLGSGGRPVARGVLSRAECDPYQTAWCIARGAPDVTLAPGRYHFRLDRPSICQNAGSGGAGFIKAWGHER